MVNGKDTTVYLKCHLAALLGDDNFFQKLVVGLQTYNAQIDILEGAISADMVKDCQRWGTSYSYWQERVAFLRSFCGLRTPKVIKQVKSFFDLTDAELRDYGFPV